ncbi:sulfite oxidase [Aureococcus anophagefferens]|nr:sulfite oxidase [Aureococcus anophagefferens]
MSRRRAARTRRAAPRALPPDAKTAVAGDVPVVVSRARGHGAEPVPERLALAHADWLAKSGRNFRWDVKPGGRVPAPRASDVFGVAVIDHTHRTHRNEDAVYALSNERLVSSDELASHDERLVSSDELASHDFTPVAEGGSGRLWVSYKRGVYDDGLGRAAPRRPREFEDGGPARGAYWAHWSVHVQDPSAALPVLEKYRVGRLAEDEEDDDDDPYADEPDRAARIAAGLRPLKAGAGGKATGPFEAECDVPGLSFLTPADIFYVRNHAPAPPEDAPAFASASPAARASARRRRCARGDFGPVVAAAPGFAYAGDGRGVARVDVSFDGGETWTAAALEPAVRDDARWAWRLWRAAAPRDATTLDCAVRATDLAGVAQPLAPRDAIAHMPKGYLFNAVHRVAFDAAEPVHCNRLN